ncbi:MAG: hypothetical protein AABY22_24365 [Nanoarchaeota archaeon]
MKYGYFIGLDRKQKRLEVNREPTTMEEFMHQHNINNSNDLLIINSPQGPNREYAFKHRDAIVNALLQYFHGSSNPRVVSSARNTSLFEVRGPAVGDFNGDLNMSLMEFVSRLKTGILPELEEPKATSQCVECKRGLPESDPGSPSGTFGGVIQSNKLYCFKCYQKLKGW